MSFMLDVEKIWRGFASNGPMQTEPITSISSKIPHQLSLVAAHATESVQALPPPAYP